MGFVLGGVGREVGDAVCERRGEQAGRDERGVQWEEVVFENMFYQVGRDRRWGCHFCRTTVRNRVEDEGDESTRGD